MEKYAIGFVAGAVAMIVAIRWAISGGLVEELESDTVQQDPVPQFPVYWVQ